jgi:hypothetical protein
MIPSFYRSPVPAATVVAGRYNFGPGRDRFWNLNPFSLVLCERLVWGRQWKSWIWVSVMSISFVIPFT